MSHLDRRQILPDNCHHCGHLKHADECPGVIERGTTKKPNPTDCPCVKRAKETK